MINRRGLVLTAGIGAATLLVSQTVGSLDKPETNGKWTWWRIPFVVSEYVEVTDIGGYRNGDSKIHVHEALVYAPELDNGQPDNELIEGVIAFCCRDLSLPRTTVEGTKITSVTKALQAVSGDAFQCPCFTNGSPKLGYSYKASIIFHIPPAWVELSQVPSYRLVLKKNIMGPDGHVDVIHTAGNACRGFEDARRGKDAEKSNHRLPTYQPVTGRETTG